MNKHDSIAFDQDLANYIAQLAKLDPSHPALSHIVRDMQRILAMVEVLDEVNTEGVEPLRHPLELPNLMREDVVQESDRDMLLDAAPAIKDGLFLVPQIIE